MILKYLLWYDNQCSLVNACSLKNCYLRLRTFLTWMSFEWKHIFVSFSIGTWINVRHFVFVFHMACQVCLFHKSFTTRAAFKFLTFLDCAGRFMDFNIFKESKTYLTHLFFIRLALCMSPQSTFVLQLFIAYGTCIPCIRVFVPEMISQATSRKVLFSAMWAEIFLFQMPPDVGRQIMLCSETFATLITVVFFCGMNLSVFGQVS